MALDLHKNARHDERFHLQKGQPVPHVSRVWWIYTKVSWSNLFPPDRSPGTFESWWVIGNAVHWYKGNVKCDGTRTRMYWWGRLDDGKGIPYVPETDKYVMSTTEKE